MTNSIFIYAASEPGAPYFSADLLWRTNFRAPDPIAYLEHDGKKILLASSLEFGRAQKEANVDEVLLIDDFIKHAKEPNLRSILQIIFEKRDVKEIKVPASFPYALGHALEKIITITPVKNSLFPERAIKTDREVAEIENAGVAVGQTIEKVREVLRQSEISGNEVSYQKTPLTSEWLRDFIENDLFQRGYLATNTIVACGAQAADPHMSGHGPIAPYQPIVFDIFPVSRTSHYYADISRTLFKGEPSLELKKMYTAVRDGQATAIAAAKKGMEVRALQKTCLDFFTAEGYPTSHSGGEVAGFIHSLGHGVGLEVHEDPHVGEVPTKLERSNVITIEPGLYYAKTGETTLNVPIGGIRLEDMITITDSGARVLAPLPSDLAWAIL